VSLRVSQGLIGGHTLLTVVPASRLWTVKLSVLILEALSILALTAEAGIYVHLSSIAVWVTDTIVIVR
jgi:hypothetical protein